MSKQVLASADYLSHTGGIMTFLLNLNPRPSHAIPVAGGGA
jgi:hypothetical protein